MLFNLQTEIHVNCFYCGSQDIRVVGAATILADNKWICSTIDSEEGLPRDADFSSEEKLIKGFCIPCQKTFSLDIHSSRGDSQGLRETEDIHYVQVHFSGAGVPEALIIESQHFPITKVKSHAPISLAALRNGFSFFGLNDPMLHVDDEQLEPLFGRSPFGKWGISFNPLTRDSTFGISLDVDCVLDVSPLKSLGMTHGDILSIRVVKADEGALKILATSKANHTTQPLGHRFLTLAAFGAFIEIERTFCKLIWDGLEESFGKDDIEWWKKSLGAQISGPLRDRIKRAHPRKPLQNDFHSYLTLGEGIALMDSKWDRAFSKRFKGKKRLMLQLNELERLRNVVAHGRPIDFKDYVKCAEIAATVRESLAGAQPDESDSL